MNISIVCSLGLGTSFIIKVNLEKIMKAMSISAEVNHIDISMANSSSSDLYITTILHDLVPAKKNSKVILIENVLDIDELEQKFCRFIKERGNNE